ncbi:hypothetical protein DEFDS_1364 [Deferribacter desulfuricans SSM1]|uniref:M23ase beta-sheet core domain-containing protein n=1 Tax=Deferribacter desulfuricans (strain DSM 14783 / JCM 11476 / NBRC 101012 / SSM1) TaxID=639282 RepID=D3PE02_DEFDS|nr:peptidoglycan DD-metalloendopeptidase family protein [Deferribacter desulfuricans]BAI80825.1 hypothetical protein DEFDS_1364 [Deferribacter desulfuricans SSM1]
MIFRIILIFVLIFQLCNVSAELIEEYDTTNKYLKEIKKEITKENHKLEIILKSKKSLQKKLSALNEHINRQKQLLSSINKKIEILNIEKNKLEKKIYDNEKVKESLKNKIKNFNIYLIDNQKYLKVKLLLFTKKYYDVKSALDLIEIVNSRLFELINKYQEITNKLNQLKEALNQKHKDLTNIRKLKLSVINKLENEILQKKQLLAIINEDETSIKQYLAVLKDKESELEKRFKSINKKLEKTGDKKIINSAFFKNKGKLIWPVEGKVVEFFGPKKIKGFKGIIYNKGIKIQVTGDGYVHTIFDGTVKYIDWVRGLGNIIIINHDRFFYTLYANIDEVLVAKGQQVKKGDKIGIIDVDLNNKSSYLYFEIRKESKAVDPLNWLEKRR